MRAVVYDRYGPPEVQHLEEVDRPVPKADEVLVKVHATTVTRTDCGVREGKPLLIHLFFGLLRPKQRILGTELAGEIEAVGPAVTQFAVGDHVFGSTSGFKSGTHAEFICMQESAPLAHKPARMTFEEAAAVTDGAILARMCLDASRLHKGQRILVYGASGSIGTAGVQLARALEADVTAVCSTKNGETYDVIFDAVGKHSFGRCKGSLARGGIYVATDGLFRNLSLALWTSRIGDKKVLFPIPPRYTKKNVLFIKELIETGRFRAVIDRSYPLEEVVEATRYVETERKTGNVVLTLHGEPAR